MKSEVVGGGDLGRLEAAEGERSSPRAWIASFADAPRFHGFMPPE